MKKDLFIITSAQLNSIVQMANDMEAMLGCAEPESDRIWKQRIRNVDNMLSKNGLSRKRKANPPAETVFRTLDN